MPARYLNCPLRTLPRSTFLEPPWHDARSMPECPCLCLLGAPAPVPRHFVSHCELSRKSGDGSRLMVTLSEHRRTAVRTAALVRAVCAQQHFRVRLTCSKTSKQLGIETKCNLDKTASTTASHRRFSMRFPVIPTFIAFSVASKPATRQLQSTVLCICFPTDVQWPRLIEFQVLAGGCHPDVSDWHRSYAITVGHTLESIVECFLSTSEVSVCKKVCVQYSWQHLHDCSDSENFPAWEQLHIRCQIAKKSNRLWRHTPRNLWSHYIRRST